MVAFPLQHVKVGVLEKPKNILHHIPWMAPITWAAWPSGLCLVMQRRELRQRHTGALETRKSPWSRRVLKPIPHQLQAGKRRLGSTLRFFLASNWLLVEMCTLTKPDLTIQTVVCHEAYRVSWGYSRQGKPLNPYQTSES